MILATFDHSVKEANDIYSFYFQPPKKLKFVAGQFIELFIAHDNPDNRGQKRWFTLSSSPENTLMSITTKFSNQNGSTFKNSLQKLNKNDVIEISQPMGDFVLPKDTTIPLVFIAGGIGVTPFHSIIQWLKDTDSSRPINFIYATNSPKELAFKKLFDQAIVEPHYLTNGEELTGTKLLPLIGQSSLSHIYISGPETMVENLVKQFLELGFSKNQLIADYFSGYSSI